MNLELCYDACRNGVERGGVCYGSCPRNTKACGGTLCVDMFDSCSNYIMDIEEILQPKISLDALGEPKVIDIAALATEDSYQNCDAW